MEMEKVHNWITETKGYQPFVMDADELQKDPGRNNNSTQFSIFNV